MQIAPNLTNFVKIGVLAVFAFSAIGCEGIGRRHGVEISLEPPPDGTLQAQGAGDVSNLPDLVEEMHAARQYYLDRLLTLERGFLMCGDTVRANWARRQRELTERVEPYPFLIDTAPEELVVVAPEQSIPEADALYEDALKLLKSFEGIPFGGLLEMNRKKARRALAIFKRVLVEHPTSDKVDDCAFYCGQIYREYLREDDPDNELALRYYKWAVMLDPETPHSARFECAVVYDFRLHDREKALELYHQVLESEEMANESNMRFAATRIEQLTDDLGSHLRPQTAVATQEQQAESDNPTSATAKLPELDEPEQ